MAGCLTLTLSVATVIESGIESSVDTGLGGGQRVRGPSRKRRAHAAAASYTLSGATISSIRPSAEASSASKKRPLNTSSLALLAPTTRVRRAIPPPPGTRPARISVAPNFTLSPLTRQSAARARVEAGAQCVSGDRGHGRLRDRGDGVDRLATDPSATPASGGVNVPNSGISSPAEKISWPPNRITAATSSRSPQFGGRGRDLAIGLPGHRVGGRSR